MLGSLGNREVCVLGTLASEDEARGRAGESQEGVHRLTTSEALRRLLEELLLLAGVPRGGFLAVHVPRPGGRFGIVKVEVHGLVAVLGAGGHRGTVGGRVEGMEGKEGQSRAL